MIIKRLLIFFLVGSQLAKPILKGVAEFVSVGCCDPQLKKIPFQEKFVKVPQILLTIRALEYDSGPVGYLSSIRDVTIGEFTLQLTVSFSTLKIITFDWVAINQDEVEFGFINLDSLSVLKDAESGDKVIPTFIKFRRTFVEEPTVQVFIIGMESESKLISFEVAPTLVALQGVSLNLKKFGDTSIQKLQLSYVATQSSKELAQAVTHTGQKKAQMEQVQEPKEVKEFLQLNKPKLIQINGLNGLRFLQHPIEFMWQGDSIDPTALNVNLRITLDKGNQVVLGLYYFEEKPFRECPKIYSMCKFQGSHIYLCKDVPDLVSVMRVAKSIYIPDKTSVVVFQDSRFEGVKTKITKSIECVDDWFGDIPETERSSIKAFLQVNQMKRYKDDQVSEIRRGQHQKSETFLQMPHWDGDDSYHNADPIEEVDSFVNSFKQEKILQRLKNNNIDMYS